MVLGELGLCSVGMGRVFKKNTCYVDCLSDRWGSFCMEMQIPPLYIVIKSCAGSLWIEIGYFIMKCLISCLKMTLQLRRKKMYVMIRKKDY